MVLFKFLIMTSCDHKEQQKVSKGYISFSEQIINEHILNVIGQYILLRYSHPSLAFWLFFLYMAVVGTVTLKNTFYKKPTVSLWAHFNSGSGLRNWVSTRLGIKLKSREAFLNLDLLSTLTSCWPSVSPAAGPWSSRLHRTGRSVLQGSGILQLIRKSSMRGNPNASSLSVWGLPACRGQKEDKIAQCMGV